MLMMIRDHIFTATPPARIGGAIRTGGPSWHGGMRPLRRVQPRSLIQDLSSKTCLLELTVDAVGELVQAFVDGNLLRDHLLQGGGPFGGQVEEQRLRREVDLGAWSRDVML